VALNDNINHNKRSILMIVTYSKDQWRRSLADLSWETVELTSLL